MKKITIILVLIVLLAGAGYVTYLVIGGMGLGSGGEQDAILNTENNTENTETSVETGMGELDESGFGDFVSSSERSGISIDKDLLNKKINIPNNEIKKELSISSSTESLISATSSKKDLATSTKIKEPVIDNILNNVSSTTSTTTSKTQISNPVENASSSDAKLME